MQRLKTYQVEHKRSGRLLWAMYQSDVYILVDTNTKTHPPLQEKNVTHSQYYNNEKKKERKDRSLVKNS